MRRIGLVGVGLLGSTVAARLLEHGFEVIGYDKRTTQLEALRPLPRLDWPSWMHPLAASAP